MKYRNQELPRLYRCKVYVGDPDAKRPRTEIETVVAWNAMDANRKLGNRRLVSEPEALCFVWQEDEDSPILRIDSTAGPSEEIVTPSVAIAPE